MAASPQRIAGLGLLLATLLFAMPPADSDLSISQVRLPDGPVWTPERPGPAGRLGLEFALKNVGAHAFDVWDPKNSEGSVCPSLVLTAPDGRTIILRQPGIERSGMPTVVRLAPGETLRITLNLADMAPDGAIAGGPYRATLIYRNKLSAAGPYHGVWTGELHSSPFDLQVGAAH